MPVPHSSQSQFAVELANVIEVRKSSWGLAGLFLSEVDDIILAGKIWDGTLLYTHLKLACNTLNMSIVRDRPTLIYLSCCLLLLSTFNPRRRAKKQGKSETKAGASTDPNKVVDSATERFDSYLTAAVGAEDSHHILNK